MYLGRKFTRLKEYFLMLGNGMPSIVFSFKVANSLLRLISKMIVVDVMQKRLKKAMALKVRYRRFEF